MFFVALLCFCTLWGMGVVTAGALTVKHQKTSDAEFHGHGDPHARKPQETYQHHSKAQAHDLDASEIHKAWDKRIPRPP